MGEDEKVTILDEYDCSIMNNRLRISIDSRRDPSLSDIMSEIYDSNGRIYFDGSYYMYSGEYDIVNCETRWYLDLHIN